MGQRKPNSVLRRIREVERAESRAEFAKAINAKARELSVNVSCDERTVARFEDGSTRCPGYGYRRVLEALCGRPFSELGFASGRRSVAGSRTDAQVEEERSSGDVLGRPKRSTGSDFRSEELQRRVLLQGFSLVAAGMMGSSWATLEAVRHGLTASLDPQQDIDSWHGVADAYCREFYTVPPEQLIPALTMDILQLQQALEISSANRPVADLQIVAAQLSVIMSMCLASQGGMRGARRWWSTARSAADTSSDRDMRVWVRAWEAVNGLYEGRPLAAVTALAGDAVAIGGESASSGMAGALAGSAQALAVQGRADAAMTALGRLRDLVDRLPDETIRDEDSMSGWPEYRLRHTASYVCTHLGKTRQAYAEQECALVMYPPELARERAQLQMHRAACRVLDGDVAGGLEYSHDTLDAIPQELHNEMLFERARHVLAVLPEGMRGLSLAEDLRRRLAPPSTFPPVQPFEA